MSTSQLSISMEYPSTSASVASNMPGTLQCWAALPLETFAMIVLPSV
jgi:hypothetical protein